MSISVIWAGAILGGIAMICIAGLKAWRGWLDLRRHEIASERALFETSESGGPTRIELADVKERLRKLEAIARDVDL